MMKPILFALLAAVVGAVAAYFALEHFAPEKENLKTFIPGAVGGVMGALGFTRGKIAAKGGT